MFSAADEADDILAMASEALELWAEGMREDGLPIPEPRDFVAVRNDPKWQASFADAQLVIAVQLPWHARSQAAE